MSDDTRQQCSDARMQARAAIAAALIEAKVVNLSGIFFTDQSVTREAPALQKLKRAVEAVMTAVVMEA